uniref:Uncharacterized protein n=1 Tax=Anguilla anguilla TaxID=7936 RepID=A0A0E9T146_ANGAN
MFYLFFNPSAPILLSFAIHCYMNSFCQNVNRIRFYFKRITGEQLAFEMIPTCSL